MTSKIQLIDIVKKLKLHQIRSGTTHRFVDISIVETQGRFFVRQYKFGAGSWRDAFLGEPNGEMRCGDLVVPIKGIVPDDLNEINPAVTRAFWKKYHLIYALMQLGFNRKRHQSSTIELVPQFEEESDGK